ncbi:hypothetical protein PG995_015625 [Apiospora arundinis]
MKPYTESSDNTHESFNAAPSGEEEDDAGEDDEANVYSMQVAGSQNGRANWRCLLPPTLEFGCLIVVVVACCRYDSNSNTTDDDFWLAICPLAVWLGSESEVQKRGGSQDWPSCHGGIAQDDSQNERCTATTQSHGEIARSKSSYWSSTGPENRKERSEHWSELVSCAG